MKDDAIGGEVLAQIPIFRGLDDAERRQFLSLAASEAYQPGEYVLHEGQTSRYLWIVMQGRCEVVRQWRSGDDGSTRDVQLTVLEPYACFGEMSFFHPAAHSASVRAITALELLSISREAYDTLMCDGSPAACKLAHNAVNALAERIRHIDEWIIDRVRREAAGRKVEEWEDFRAKLFSGWEL